MSQVRLTDEQWTKICSFLRQDVRAYVGQEEQCRRFVEGVLWMMRSGAQWRLLPKVYGAWNSVYKRYARWCDHDVWSRLHRSAADDPDLESLLIDSTIVRAHPCAAGAPGQKGGSKSRHSAAVGAASPARFIWW
jgi:transposase